MSTADREALCGRCKVALEGPANPKSQDRFSCPRCGSGDTLHNVRRILGEYVADQMAEKVSATFDNAFRGSKYVKVEKQFRPKRTHRFIIDMKSI